MNEFLEQFLIESRELVEQATDDLLALEQAPEDHERLDSAFRAFHTLKGSAGIVEFDAMGRAMHAAEDLLASVRAGDYAVTADLIGNCLACLDQISQWLAAMEADGEPPADADRAADRLVARFAPGAAAPAAASPSEERPSWVDRLLADAPDQPAAAVAVRYEPDSGCFFRAEDPLERMGRLPGLLALRISPRQPWPPLEDLDPFACNLILDALSSASAEEAAGHLRPVRDQVKIHALPQQERARPALPDRAAGVLQAQIALARAPAGDSLAGRLGSAGRVASNVLGHLGLTADAAQIDRALGESLAAADPGAFLASLEAILNGPLGGARPAGAEEALAGAAAPGPQDAPARALRVDVHRIDAIVKLTGELTVVKNALGHVARLAQDGGDPKALALALKEQHALMERLTAELQQSVLAVRVLPLRHIFRRFPRLVREMAESLGKAARLVTEGETTEADKAVVEALFEPLLHVLRNAVDHGVGPAERRASLGKSETGTIHLRGHREGEHVIIDVTDDGRGIDPAEVRRVALDRGLMSAAALSALSDEETLNLIFAPGFSTASAVTGISGRGVGMDAVRYAVERMGGRVSVFSRLGEGTSVRFTLPFTLMMTRLMTVEAAGQVFGVPFEAVVETVQLQRDRIIPVGAAEAFVLRGRTIPLVSLARTLALDGDGETSPTANAVVIEVGGQLGALEVDRFGGRMDVMLKPMDGLLAGMTGVAGTTLLGDGRVLIVLDLQELLR